MRFFLFNLAANTEDDRFHCKNSIDGKLSLLNKALQYMQKVLNSCSYTDTRGQPIRGILVAPEYFFARSFPEFYLRNGTKVLPERNGRHYEYNDYIRIRRGLTQLSRWFPSILIIPGTVAWKEAIAFNADIQDPYSQSENQTPSGIDQTVTEYAGKDGGVVSGFSGVAPVPSWARGSRYTDQRRYNKFMLSIGEILTDETWSTYQRERPDHKLLTAIESVTSKFADLQGGRGVGRSTKVQAINTIVDVNPEEFIEKLRRTQFGLAWNTAFFYLGGRKVGEYAKHSDYQESLNINELSIATVGTADSILHIKNLKIGIEICLDHNCDVLSNYITLNNVPRPDIHLVLSAAVKKKQSLANEDNGLFIHSSSRINFNEPRLFTSAFQNTIPYRSQHCLLKYVSRADILKAHAYNAYDIGRYQHAHKSISDLINHHSRGSSREEISGWYYFHGCIHLHASELMSASRLFHMAIMIDQYNNSARCSLKLISQQFINYGCQAYDTGEYENAYKLFTISMKVYPNEVAKNNLQLVDSIISQQQDASSCTVM